jgi:hypothetical protein
MMNPQDQIEQLSPKQEEMLQYAVEHTSVEGKSWTPENLIGKRVVVQWTQPGAKGKWAGEIVDYVRHSRRYAVKYDQASLDGTQVYEEDLLGPNPPQWVFEETSKSKCARGRDARNSTPLLYDPEVHGDPYSI